MKLPVSALLLAVALSQEAVGRPLCASIQDDAERLECFDRTFPASRAQGDRARWHTEIDTSPLDDSSVVLVYGQSSELIRNHKGQREHGEIIFLCEEGVTSVHFYFAGFLMTQFDGGDEVDYRIDKRPAGRRTMDISTDNRALGLWSSDDAIALATELMAAEQLYVRATPMSESPVGMTFDLDGLEEALAPLRAACAW